MQMFPFLFESICSASLSIVLLNELLRKQLSVKSQATPRDESRRDTPSALMFTAALRILLTVQFISHLQQMDSDKVCGQMERCMIYAHPSKGDSTQEMSIRWATYTNVFLRLWTGIYY